VAAVAALTVVAVVVAPTAVVAAGHIDNPRF
jgi:hypothetical protein